MGDRGRKPAAELANVTDLPVTKRPSPPDHLTAEQRQIWVETVGAMASDWFRPETLEVLAQYCRHVIEAREVARMIEQMKNTAENFDVREYALLLRCHKAESEAILSTATKLRITLQSTYDKSKSKDKGNSKKPWQRTNA